MIIDIIFIVLLSLSILLVLIATYIDGTPTGVETKVRRHQAVRQVELNRLRSEIHRDAEKTRRAIDRAANNRKYK
jgi:hypothetical protein